MKSNLFKCALVVLLLGVGGGRGFCQAFTNLDFENPVLPLNPDQNFQVPASKAVPGWTTYTYGTPSTQVYYNTLSLGAAAVSLQGPGSGQPAIQGSYFVVLQGSTGGPAGTAALGQTGKIPASARSLMFWGYAGLDNASFNGETLNLFVANTTANYDVYEADISALAGQTGQLLFTAPPSFQDYVDNIQFLTSPVPEPGTLALVAAGAVLILLRPFRARSL